MHNIFAAQIDVRFWSDVIIYYC